MFIILPINIWAINYEQSYKDGIIVVLIDDSNNKPINTNTILTNNSILNSILEDFNTEKFHQLFPHSKNDTLLSVYLIEFDGKTNELINELAAKSPTSFQEIIKIYKEDDISLYEPSDHYWQTDRLWHLTSIQADLAWDITTGDPEVKIAIIDTWFDIEHPDLAEKIEPHYDPYCNTPFSADCTKNNHGTTVASFAAAHTDDGGHLSSIGFNSMIIPYRAHGIGYVAYLARAQHASLAMNADIITSSAGGWRCGYSQIPENDPYYEIERIAVKEILDNGTVIIMPAGNGPTGTRCRPVGSIYDQPWYPLHPKHDDRIIIVTSVGEDNKHYYYHEPNESEETHSHYPEVDLCAPGYITRGARGTLRKEYDDDDNFIGCIERWPYWSNYIGTSYATPIVAGLAALIKSIDKDLTPAEIKYILKSTTDPVLDAEDYEGLIGTGKINAYESVKFANDCPSLIITSNEVWDFEKINICELRIESSATLEIQNTLYLGRNSKIIIEKGGKLIINGGKLTSLDNYPWQGIYVEGDRTLSQTFENQGALILNNGAIIENARTAVRLRGYDSSWHFNGGIVKATDATFLNNWRNVAFSSYQDTLPSGQPKDNISFFTNCEFITNDGTPHNTHTNNVSMWKVTGVRFTNCIFMDDRKAFHNGSIPSRNGIYSISSTFRVWGCEFENMTYGIHATASEPNRYFSVYLSDFASYKGIYFNAKDNVSIMNNTFNVTPGYDYLGGKCDDTYGIYINNSANFTIENNTLISSSNGSTHCGSLGIVARNTGSFSNEIYRNDILGFTVGIEAIGKNRGINSDEGLALICNRNWENAFDFIVTSDQIYRPTGIRYLQGNPSANHTSDLAGNIFGNNSSILDKNFINTEANIAYFHHDTISEPMVRPSIYSDPPKINLYVGVGGYDYSYETSCPEQPLEKVFAELQAERNDAMSHYAETALLLEAYVDDGSTELMTQQVDMAGEGDAYSTYQYLMQTSPYLSEEVLSTLAAKEEGFNKAMIRDVLVANSQAAKSEEVDMALDNRIDPLPAYMRWQINNGLYQFSEKEIMNHFMAYQKSRHDHALNRILGGIIRNEEGFENAPPIEDILDDVEDIRYQYMLAEWHFGKGNFAQGMQLLGQIEQDFDLSDEALWYAHEDKLSFYNWLAQWDQEAYPGYFGLPEEALQELETYLDATPRVAGKTLSLLVLNEAIEYEEPILYPIMHHHSGPVHHENMPYIPLTDEEFSFSLFPNPSKEYITLDWCFDSPQRTGIIEIRNSNGVLMDVVNTEIHCNQRIYSLTHLKSGTYTATLISGSYIRKTLSFIVIK